jgi:acyl-CoA reductase-like NAD-dependent aldehyde dehydrogenase
MAWSRWIPKIAEAAGKLRVGPGNASETDVGPLISKQVGDIPMVEQIPIGKP